MWEMYISSSNTYKLEAQNIPFFSFQKSHQAQWVIIYFSGGNKTHEKKWNSLGSLSFILIFLTSLSIDLSFMAAFIMVYYA